MRSSDFIVPFLVSAAIHVGVLYSDSPHRNAEIFFEKGISAVTLNIICSSASEASSIIPVAAEPAGKHRLSAPPYSDKKEITSRKTGPTHDAPLYPKKKPVVEQRTQKIHNSGIRKENAQGKAVLENILPKTHVRRSETNQQLPVKPLVRNKKESVRQSYNYPVETHEVNLKDHDGNLEEKGVISPAVVTGLIKPKYPRYSRINGEEGTVVFIVEVHADGTPGKIEIQTSSGYRRLDRAAAKALENAGFMPARLSGRAVASTKRIAFRFDLEEYGNWQHEAK
nr:energy transducer TonB [Deltaproteobacteria bacterium]